MSTNSTVPATHRLTALTVTMLAMCGPMMAEDAAPVVAPAAADQSAGIAPERAAEIRYQQGVAALDKLDLPNAITYLTQACDSQPGNPTYRAALDRAKSMAGVSPDVRSQQVAQISQELAVKQQELWIDAQSRLAEGEKAAAAGDFAEAERSFTMAQIRLENLPYSDARRSAELRRVESLLEVARSGHARQERSDAAGRAQQAMDRKRELREASLKIERDRIDALLHRAQKARERRDFDEAILLCENILKINRAEDRAQGLLAKCRRERHVYLRQVTADRWDEEHKLLSENIRSSMLPQLEIVNYSPDWYRIDALRSAPDRGMNGDGEEWRANIVAQLEQKVNVKFDQQELVDVVAFLQKVTGVNIVLDPQVVAGGATQVTMNVTDMQLKYVLDFIMKATSLSYSLRDEAIFISNAKGLRGNLMMKLYDIRDLTHTVENFAGPDINIPEPGNQQGNILPPVEPKQKQDVNAFIEIIKQVVAPNQWDGDGITIQEYAGSMVVTQTGAIHKSIEELLRTLRNQQATQVHVKVKFLTVENSLLEEIGVNWQNFDVANLAGTAAPIGANGALPGQTMDPTGGAPNPFGAYHQQGSVIGAAGVNSQLGDYSITNGLSTSNSSTVQDGVNLQGQYWRVADNFYVSALLHAVEKERRGNVLFEPDLTLFNGEQGHVVNLVQQAYIATYDVNQGQYDPQIATLSYGTVLDVQPIVSADKKYITLTVRPTNAQLIQWRRFGRPNTQMSSGFGGANVNQAQNGVDTSTLNQGLLGAGGTGGQYAGIAGGDIPLTLPEINYQAVRTSVTIPDGGSIMLAGMNNSATKHAHTGVPFLSHIPFLGRLFSSNGRNEMESKTMIVLQADVVLYEEIEKKL